MSITLVNYNRILNPFFDSQLSSEDLVPSYLLSDLKVTEIARIINNNDNSISNKHLNYLKKVYANKEFFSKWRDDLNLFFNNEVEVFWANRFETIVNEKKK